jgi:type II secretory pathway pseudopilin PulG
VVRHIHASQDDGFTLIEMLVTILIGMIVLAAALIFMTNAFTSSAKVQDREDSTTRSRITLDRAVSLLQAQVCNGTTEPIVEATPVLVKFTANTGAVADPPKGFILEYEDTAGAAGSGQLVAKQFALGLPNDEGYRDWDPTPERTSVISEYLAPESPGAPVFRYFGWAGVAETSPDPEYVELTGGGGPGQPGTSELGKILRVDALLRSFPGRTNKRTDRTSSLIDASAYVSSHIDQTKLGDGPQCV